jgi:hypothetical protein
MRKESNAAHGRRRDEEIRGATWLDNGKVCPKIPPRRTSMEGKTVYLAGLVRRKDTINMTTTSIEERTETFVDLHNTLKKIANDPMTEQKLGVLMDEIAAAYSEYETESNKPPPNMSPGQIFFGRVGVIQSQRDYWTSGSKHSIRVLYPFSIKVGGMVDIPIRQEIKELVELLAQIACARGIRGTYDKPVQFSKEDGYSFELFGMR